MISDVKHLYLCRPDLSIITELNGVNRESVSYSQHTKDFDTLDFVVDEYIESPGDSDGLIEGYRKSNGYDYLDKSMYILLEDVGYFIMEYPVIENDGVHETKQVSAYSIEKELYYRDWLNFKINTGEEDSLESIATDNLNELGIPKNFVTFYCPSNPELSLLDLLLTKLPGWSLGEIDPLLVNKKIGQYKEPNINIYALLTSVIGPKVPCIFTFDIMHRKINAYSQESLELDSNIFIGFRNLAQNVSIQVEEDSIITRLRCYGDNELSFEALNYGSTQIVNLSYFMREPYMSDELVAKVEAWQAYQDENRETFKELGRASADLNEKMDEVKYRVPSDGVMQDWSDLNEEALLESQKYYEALLTSLQVSVDPNPQYDAEEKYIPWDDGEGNVDHERYLALLYDLANGYGGYYTYKEIQEYILPNIQIALDNLNIPEDDQESYVETWKTNWDLYGIEELEGKRKDYTNRLEALVVYSKDWEDLTEEEKAAQVNEDYYNIQHAGYTKIAGYLDEDSPTSLPAKLAELQAEYDDLKDQLDLNEENRIAMINPSRMYYTNDDGEIVYNFEFTAADMAIVEPLLIDSDYVNSNIISTSVDTSVSRFDRQQELFDDSVDKLSELCQPQYRFTTNLDNLYRLPEFEDFAEDLKLLTYIRLGIRDDYSVKLRVVGITWNPCEITPDLELEFSNMISSRSGRTDYVDILQTENERASKNSVALGTGNSDTDKEYLTNLLNLMITNRLFTNAVSNITGIANGGNADSAGNAGTANYAATAGTAATALTANMATNAINIDPNGNISSIISDYIRANKIDVGYITGDAADFRRLFADYIDAESIVTNVLKADQATLNQLTTKVVTADSISTGILNATDAQITNIKSKVVTADDVATKLLSATDANITNLSSKLVTSEMVTTAVLNATDAQIQNLRSSVISADDITTRLLSAENARLGELSAGIIEAGEATIRDLAANNVTADYIFTDILSANQGRVETLISNISSSATSQIFNLTSTNATIDSVLARSIVAGNVQASDIQAGNITLSDNLKIVSENGQLTANGDTILIGRTNQDGTLRSGVQIGYNAQDEPSVIVKNENGATVMTAEGITSDAVADSLIVNRMVQDKAITPGKLSFNIETDEDGNVVTSIDNIYLGDGGKFGSDYTTFKESTQGDLADIQDAVDSSMVYQIEIVSSNGDAFKHGEVSTTLSAHVYKQNEDITDYLDANAFHWWKINSDGTHDTEWETNHAAGRKSITITSADVYRRATFNVTVDGIPASN